MIRKKAWGEFVIGKGIEMRQPLRPPSLSSWHQGRPVCPARSWEQQGKIRSAGLRTQAFSFWALGGHRRARGKVQDAVRSVLQTSLPVAAVGGQMESLHRVTAAVVTRAVMGGGGYRRSLTVRKRPPGRFGGAKGREPSECATHSFILHSFLHSVGSY